MVRMALIEETDSRLRIAQNKARAGKRRIQQQLGKKPDAKVAKDEDEFEDIPIEGNRHRLERRVDAPADSRQGHDVDGPHNPPPPLGPSRKNSGGGAGTMNSPHQSPASPVVLDFVNGTSKIPVEPLEAGSSSISCKTIDAHIPHTVCDTHNIVVSVQGLRQSHPHSMKPKFGTIISSCALNETRWFRPHVFGNGAVGWFRGGVDILSSSESVHCDAWVNTPVFAIKRWNTINPFHVHQDLLNTFIAYAALELDASKMQVVVLDERAPDGPFVSAYTDVFSSSSEFLDLWEVASLAPEEANICFKRVIWSSFGQISAISLESSRETKCKLSPLILAFRRFMLDRWRRAILGPKGIDPGSLPVDTRVSGLPPLPVEKSYLLDLGIEPVLGRKGKDVKQAKDVPAAERPRADSKPDKEFGHRLARRGGGRQEVEIPFVDEADEQMYDIDVPTIMVTYAIRRSPSLAGPIYTEEAGHDDHNDEREGELVDDTGLAGALKNASAQEQAADAAAADAPHRLERRFGSSSGGKNSGRLQRILKNEAELIERIREAISKWTSVDPDPSKKNDVKIKFRAVDFAAISLEEQISIAQDTDILIGPHGGALFHVLYLRADPVGALLELKPVGLKDKNFQYRNLAYQLGFRYDMVPIGNTNVHNLDLVVRRLRYLLVEVYRIRRNHLLAAQASTVFNPPESDESIIKMP
ncbi:hypothetical protein HDU96_002217 [Phlyctochytrium bullatum]|nr:hypothetical protein HDU96_002217 [Phlyctochytrium bullatum]